MRFVPGGLAATFDPCLRQASPWALALIDTPYTSGKMNYTRTVLCSLACIAFSAPAAALSFTMNFDGPPSALIIPSAYPEGGLYDPDVGSAVLGYYNGDSGSNPPFPREGSQSWNTVFSSSAVAVCSRTASIDCGGDFPATPSASGAVVAVDAESFYFEITGGLLVTQLSFYYGADGTGSEPGITLYSGSELIFVLELKGCEGGGFCGWEKFTVPESELAGKAITKVEFFGAPNKVAFDDIFVTTTPIPEPSTYALALAGLALVAGTTRRRRSR